MLAVWPSTLDDCVSQFEWLLSGLLVDRRLKFSFDFLRLLFEVKKFSASTSSCRRRRSCAELACDGGALSLTNCGRCVDVIWVCVLNRSVPFGLHAVVHWVENQQGSGENDTRVGGHSGGKDGTASVAKPPTTPAKVRLRKLHSAPIESLLSTGMDMDSLRCANSSTCG